MSRISDIAGQRFERLVVLELAPRIGGFWRCVCDCGAERVVHGSKLRTGHTRSCGCIKGRHRMWKSPEYHAWAHMRARCENVSHPDFHNYGGRGITVCERWQSFDNFIADVGIRPSSKHSLDRIDNDQGYEPGNVRWATRTEQNRNRRDVKLTPDLIRLLRVRREAGETVASLAREVGTESSSLGRALRGHTWKGI